ncbi:MAG: DHH family phosphoesterase [Clostridia bacterium]|nr:DHH family phosphoesterase [Clostridia bacterium]
MKNKYAHTVPYLVLFAVAMMLLAIPAAFYNLNLFFVQCSIALVAVIAAIILYFLFARYVQFSLRNSLKHVRNADTGFAEKLNFPVAVVNTENELVYYNKAFKKHFCPESNLMGIHIDYKFLSADIADIVKNEGTAVKYGDKQFTAFGADTGTGAVLYFFDDTYYKKVDAEYKATRQSVAMVVFDNREAFTDAFEEESAHVVLQVEDTLQKWAADSNALYRKLAGNRYMIIFEERELKKIIETKFDILDKIHEIKMGEVEATVSIGIGRGEKNLRKSQGSAKRALDMALGRGGDQAAIATGKDFDFYGGKSQGVEKQTKVRTRMIADSVANAVAECDKVVITGHRFSDLDSIGASIGMYRAVTRSLGKKACIAVNYETSMAKSLIDKYKADRGEGIFVSPQQALTQITPKTLLIIVDTQTVNMLEDKRLYEHCGACIVIDHHRRQVDHIDDAVVFLNEPGASSASELCTSIIDNFEGEPLGKPEAEALLSGIILDTKNFVINAGSAAFETAAYLRKKGADTIAIRQHFADSVESYKNKYQLISTAKIYKECAIVLVQDEVSDVRLLAAKAADELLLIKGVKASFVMYRTEAGTINISARSFGKHNVQVVMEKMGGGGHHTMAAAQLNEKSFEAAVAQLIEAIDA